MSDANTKIESVSVEDLLCNPGRKTRPEHLVVILRGLPGSGKSHVAKLLKVLIFKNTSTISFFSRPGHC